MIYTKCIFPEEFDTIFSQCNEVFSEDYIALLKSRTTFKESLVARKCIRDIVEQHFQIQDFLPAADTVGKPLFESGIFWSISHKESFVFVAVSDIPLGIDMETLNMGNTPHLDQFSDSEYEILGGKTLENFYTLWTAKESILKYQIKVLDDLQGLVLVDFENEMTHIGNLDFEKTLMLVDDFGEEFTVYHRREKDMFFSICF